MKTEVQEFCVGTEVKVCRSLSLYKRNPSGAGRKKKRSEGNEQENTLKKQTKKKNKRRNQH